MTTRTTKSPNGTRTAAAKRPVSKAISSRRASINKHGQALGRKGSETRQRLMDATRRLLVDTSPFSLTAVSIAKEAETSSATFYIYFDDVREIMHALSEAASAELAEVRRILEEDADRGVPDAALAQRVVDCFNDIWTRHRDVLRFRNLEADRGDRDFLDQRVRSSVRIIDRFVDRIIAAYPGDQRPTRGEAYAEATALFAAMEGLAETDPAVVEEWRIGATRLSRAAAKLLARSFGLQVPPPEIRSASTPTPTPAPAPAPAPKARATAVKRPAGRKTAAKSAT